MMKSWGLLILVGALAAAQQSSRVDGVWLGTLEVRWRKTADPASREE